MAERELNLLLRFSHRLTRSPRAERAQDEVVDGFAQTNNLTVRTLRFIDYTIKHSPAYRSVCFWRFSKQAVFLLTAVSRFVKVRRINGCRDPLDGRALARHDGHPLPLRGRG